MEIILIIIGLWTSALIAQNVTHGDPSGLPKLDRTKTVDISESNYFSKKFEPSEALISKEKKLKEYDGYFKPAQVKKWNSSKEDFRPNSLPAKEIEFSQNDLPRFQQKLNMPKETRFTDHPHFEEKTAPITSKLIENSSEITIRDITPEEMRARLRTQPETSPVQLGSGFGKRTLIPDFPKREKTTQP